MMDSITVGSNPDESVGHRNLVQVRVLPVEEVGVRPPDPREELQRFEEKPIELYVALIKRRFFRSLECS